MTLSEAKQRIYDLTDLVPTDDEADKFNNFFDEAQKDIAKYIPIVKTVSITVADNTYTNTILDFLKLRCFYDSDYKRVGFKQVGTNVYRFDNDGTYTMEYCAMPTTISSATLDTYAFEIPTIAHDLLPYYVAAKVMDIDSDLAKYNLFMGQYQGKLQNLIANQVQIVINSPSTFG